MSPAMSEKNRSYSLEDQRQELAEYEKTLNLFGTDVASIPCFRNSFLYGITGGFGSGIAHFAFSSKITNATRFGFYSFIGVTLTYWFYCRYNFAVARFKYKQIKHALQMGQQLEGTPDDIMAKMKQEERVAAANAAQK